MKWDKWAVSFVAQALFSCFQLKTTKKKIQAINGKHQNVRMQQLLNIWEISSEQEFSLEKIEVSSQLSIKVLCIEKT